MLAVILEPTHNAMTNQTTLDYLNYFVTSHNPNFAVMLKGKWGAGKTYFIKGIIEEWDTSQATAESEITLKPIYISLNGISKKNDIIEALNTKISPFLYSKGAKFAKDIIKGFIKSTLKIDFDYDKDGKGDGSFNINFDPISIFKSSNDKIQGNRILIFDDVERCKIPIDELYGFINDFVEHSQCKVILISDEDKLNDENTKDSKFKYSVFKEKIVGQTFEIKPDTEQAIGYFIESVSSDIKPHLENLKDLISKTFEISTKENLRVLQRGIYDFERLFKFINPELKDDKEKYELLVKNYLAYFLIYFLEIKTGNEDISMFQQRTFLSDDKDEKKYSQYEEVITSYSLIHSTKLFTPFKLVDFIANGNYTALISELNNSSIYAKDRVEKDWERLWYWKLLDDGNFSSLLEKVSTSFFTTEDFHLTEILHISGILFSLIDSNLYKKKTKTQIVNRAKQRIKKANLSEFEDDMGFSLLTWGSWQKGYTSGETEEFKSLVKFTREILETIKNEKSVETVQEIFYKINDDNVDELYQKTRDYNDSLGNIIGRTPVLANLDPKKFAETILALNNNAIFKFMHFIEFRYFPEKTYSNVTIEDHQRQEKNTLVKLQSRITKEINSKSNKDKLIRKHNLTSLNSMIKKAISRL